MVPEIVRCLRSIRTFAADLASSASGKGAALVGADDGSSGSIFTTVAGFVAKILSSTGSAIVGFVQSGNGAVARWVLDKLREVEVSPRDYGAVGDGVANDTAAVQATLNAHNNVVIKDGTFLVDQLTIASKTRFTLKLVNAVLVERTTKTDGLIFVSSGAQISIEAHNSAIQGAETIGAYVAGDAYPAVKVTSSSDVAVRGLKVTAKTQAVFMQQCAHSRVEACEHVGIFASQPAASPVGSASFEFSGGSHNVVANNKMSNSGEGLLFGESGGSPTAYKIYGNHIDTLYDDGIYISSGELFSVFGNTVQNCTHTTNSPSGIKARGSGHAVFGNTVRSCRVGITGTGNGTTPDGFTDIAGNAYYNGHGTRIYGNYIYGCERYGLTLGNQDVDGGGNNLYPRDFVVSENTIENCGNGGFSPMLIFGGYGHKIINNSIRGSKRTIDGTSTEITIPLSLSRGTTAPNTTNLQAVVVRGNTMITAATSSNLTVNGIVRGDVSGNIVRSSGSANSLKIDNTTDTVFIGNVLSGNGSETSINEAATCSNNYFALNQGRVATYQQTASMAMDNFMTAGGMLGGATAIGAAPKQVGLLAVNAGIVYVATGTAAAADWKALN